MRFLDVALARRLEACEEIPQVQYCEALAQLRPQIGAAVAPIGDGHMTFAGPNSPIGRVTGFGVGEAVSGGQIDTIEQFYKARNAPAKIDVCPMSTPELIPLLRGRKYLMEELNNVLARRIQRGDFAAEQPPGIEIRRTRPEEAALWADVVGRGFATAVPEFAPQLTDIMTPVLRCPDVVSYIAFIDGQAVAGASAMLIRKFNVIALSGTSTLPQFRGRGIQTAMLKTRLHVAAEVGIDLACIVTQGGTTSQRNAERLGFTLCYSKATLMQPV